MEIIKNHLPLNQYFQTEFKKKYIFLHHTVGGSIESALNTWKGDAQRVGTAFIIGRDGKVVECFDPKHWAYALGITGASALEKASIQIELVSWGALNFKNGKYLNFTGKPVPEEEVWDAGPNLYRGSRYFQKYTNDQIASLNALISKVKKDFGIKVNPDPTFYTFRKWDNLPTGIWSHTTVRADKSDIIPQPELVEMVQYFR